MVNSIQAIRGMNDILPNETPFWQYLETILRQVLHSYCYQEIRTPIVEKTELFKRSIGEATDIVEKEMYTFLDRNDDSLTLRPEGTAGCVRACLEHGLLYNQISRLWYLGPYFRHERPQKGRYRQFYQCGVEAFGMEGPDIDAEVILLSAKILEKLDLLPHVTLQLNSLGSPQSRQSYRAILIKYFEQQREFLDEDSRRRMSTNPLRILDSKNPTMQEIIAGAPKLIDHLDLDSQKHFEQLQNYLTGAGLSFNLNPQIVRGLDYYTKTVFEWETKDLGSQGAVCSGGRYDGLIEQLGGKPTSAVGFGMGLDRIVLLLQQLEKVKPVSNPDIFLMSDSEKSFITALNIAAKLRNEMPYLKILTYCGGGSFKNQFKKADKSGAKLALILGDEELATDSITLKFLRETIPQEKISLKDLLKYIKNL